MVADRPEAVEPWLGAWDDLAVASAQPYSAPQWVMSWWQHMRPEGAELRVVFLVEHGRLVGVAPYFLEGTTLRLLASGFARGPDIVSALDGSEGTSAFATALASIRPACVTFEAIDASSPWPAALQDDWPAAIRPSLVAIGRRPTPVVTLAPTVDEWLDGRSTHFRRQFRKYRRRFERAGGSIELAQTVSEREEAVRAFERLHSGRWSQRGGSKVPIERAGNLLRSAVRQLSPERLRLWTAGLDGRIVAVHVLVAAGTHVAAWNGGWDERHAKFSPGFLLRCAAIEDACKRGDARLSLGVGQTPLKTRLADAKVDEYAATFVMTPLGRHYPRTRLSLLSKTAKIRAREMVARLPEEQQRRLRILTGRG